IGVDYPELAERGEAHPAIVEDRSDDKPIVLSEEFGAGRRLKRAAKAVGSGGSTVDLTERAAGKNARRRHRLPVEPDEIVEVAIQVWKAQKRRVRTIIGALGVGPIAIDRTLQESAVVEVPLQRENIARVPAGACGHKRQLILRRLRNGVRARPIPSQELARSCRCRSKVVGRAGKCDMEFGLIAAGAKVCVDTAQL